MMPVTPAPTESNTVTCGRFSRDSRPQSPVVHWQAPYDGRGDAASAWRPHCNETGTLYQHFDNAMRFWLDGCRRGDEFAVEQHVAPVGDLGVGAGDLA